MKILNLILVVVVVCITKCSTSTEKEQRLSVLGHTYIVSSKKETWNRAETSCEGTLAILNKRDLLTSVKEKLFNSGQYKENDKFWVGLKNENDKLQWVNNELIQSSLTADALNENKKCYAIILNNPNENDFVRGKCDHQQGNSFKFWFICELPNSNSTDKHHITSIAQTTQPTSASASTDTSNAEGILTSTIRHVALTTSAVSSVVEATPTLSSSSPIDIKKTSTIQPSPPPSSSSSIVEVTPTLSSISSTMDITKRSTIQLSPPPSSSSSIVEATPTLSSSSPMDIKKRSTIQLSPPPSSSSSIVEATPTLSSSSPMDIKKRSTIQLSPPPSSSSSIVEATPTLSSSSPMDIKKRSTIQLSPPPSSSSSIVEATPTLSSSSPMDIKKRSTIQLSPPPSSSSSIVEATPTLSSSSPMDIKKRSTIQPSPLPSSSSSYKGTTSDINPTKASLPQPSTTALSSTNDMVNHFHKVMENLNASNPKCMSELLTEYKDLMEWINKEDEDIKYNPMTDAKDIEDIALEFTKQHLNPTRKDMSISNKEIAFHAMLVDSDSDSDVIFPEAGNDPDLNTIFLPKSLLKGQETYIVNVVYKNNKTISKLTPTVMEGQDNNKNWSVNTGIFSTTIFPKRKEPFENVIITLHHIQKTNFGRPHCSFWNFSIPTSYNGSWSQKGCEMVSSTNTHTVCACNHLTNFAVLMKLNSQEVSSEHREALLIITYAGLALSLLGEAITVLLYCLFLNLRHEKIQIRVNFLCALAAAQIVFLAGIDKIENKDLCTFIASLIHLFYLVCFCWMLMEGVYLYRMVVKVFDAHVTMRYAYVFAFGSPLCIVAISLVAASVQSEGIYSYISEKYCWLRLENGFIWSFITPVLMLIAINCFFLFRVLKEMILMKSVKTIKSLELSSIRASARACVVLLPLLGITWLFGLLSVINTSSVNVAWQYIFTILNTMQGFMIFVFHCLRNTELQAAIKLRYFQWESTHSSTHSNRKISTPAKFLTLDESGSRSNSLPMAIKVNQVIPEKLDMKYRDEGGAHGQCS